MHIVVVVLYIDDTDTDKKLLLTQNLISSA